MKKILTIAGSDPSGGAGIQADLKTFAAHKTYGMSVITSLTAQNTMRVSEVVDPVMVATSGSVLMDSKAITALKEELLPLAHIITPNMEEASVLSGIEVKTKEDMEKAAKIIGQHIDGVVLVKGGHLEESADDLLYFEGKLDWIEGDRIENPNTHGTGCTLSSAIAANLAEGSDMREAFVKAKEYLTGAIKDGLDIGKGRGPLNHLYEYM